MTPIEAIPLAIVGESRTLMMTAGPGRVPAGIARDGGALAADYGAGAVLLADGDGAAVVGPIEMEAAHALAVRVACGDPRALTEPQAALVLATALITLNHLWPRKAERTVP